MNNVYFPLYSQLQTIHFLPITPCLPSNMILGALLQQSFEQFFQLNITFNSLVLPPSPHPQFSFPFLF